MTKNAIVVGAGIAGLAIARALSLKGYQVDVFERSERAVGASIRNFGMIWPIGQAAGVQYELAMRSKGIWQEIAKKVGFGYNQTGSLHVAYNNEEWEVIQELYESFISEGRIVELLSKELVINKFPEIKSKNLFGALYSGTEAIINPRLAIPLMASYLNESLNIQFKFGKSILHVENNLVFTTDKIHQADLIVICNGADFETLYPSIFQLQPITKCKLQMMRFKSRDANYDIGTSLCGGLSLIHYDSFKVAPSLQKLREKYQQEMPEYLSHGIHVMVSQNELGELTVGDSHLYGLTHDPFDQAEINMLILKYLQNFCSTKSWDLLQSWNGIYGKLTNGASHMFMEVEKNVFVFNGLGSSGMTLSFATAEMVLESI